MSVVGWPKKLVWAQFRTVKEPPDGSQDWASTEAHYGFKPAALKSKEGSTAFAGNVPIKIELVKSGTWVVGGKQSAELLAHEQGHWDIAGLSAHEMDRSIKSLRADSSAEFKSLLTDLSNDIGSRSSDLQISYDEDTDHGRIKSQQSIWLQRIRDAINNNYSAL